MRASCQRLTSLWSSEGDRVTVGPVAFFVKNVDSESVLRKRPETRHDGVTPLPGERQGLVLVKGLIGIQQAPPPKPVNLLDSGVRE